MLEIKEISKYYGKNRGIMALNLNCKAGEVVSLIGPNGSGKSTSLRGIAGIMRLDEGKVLLDGNDTMFPATKKDIGYLPEKMSVDGKMTPYEVLEMVNVLKNDSFYGSEEESIQMMLHDFDLWKERHSKIRHLSVGMRKKLGIIIAFMGFPKLIILDEPTNGVDTKGIITLKKYMQRAKKKNCTILVSSHILDFISTISTTNIFLKDGRVAKILRCTEGVDLEEVYKSLYLDE